jgi:hypothetical protein
MDTFIIMEQGKQPANRTAQESDALPQQIYPTLLIASLQATMFSVGGRRVSVWKIGDDKPIAEFG